MHLRLCLMSIRSSAFTC